MAHFSTQKKLGEQGRKALFCLNRNIKNYEFNIETKLSLFDTYVGRIMSYASEVWGHHHGAQLEKVHTDFLKNILNLRKTTSHNMLYFEFGRMPLSVQREIRMLKYWCKILRSNNMFLKACYEQQYEDCERGNNN